MLVGPLLPKTARVGSATSRTTSRAVGSEAAALEELAIAHREQGFNLALRVGVEAERETNALRALIEQQRKRDD